MSYRTFLYQNGTSIKVKSGGSIQRMARNHLLSDYTIKICLKLKKNAMFICVGNYKWIITNFQRLLRRLKLRDNICSFSNNTTQGFSFYLSMRARVREKGWLAQRDRENQALTLQRTGNLPGRPLYRVPMRKGRNTQLVRNFQTIFLRVPGIAHRPPTK